MTDHPLLEQLAEMDKTLLSAVITEPPDALHTEERTLTRAYLLLAHALLEEELEQIFLRHFQSVKALIAAGKPISAQLLPFYAAALEWGVASIPSYSNRDWLGFMSSPPADEHVTSVIRKNHGLKADNVRGLAKLVGVEWGLIDEAPGVQLGTLTTLGVKRGTAGHSSLFSGRNQGLAGEEYPTNVREWVSQAATTVIELEKVIGLLSAPPEEARRGLRSGRPRRFLSSRQSFRTRTFR